MNGFSSVFRFLIPLQLVFSAIHPGPILAQSDLEGPVIEHKVLDAGDLGKAQVFTATVVDNEAVESVLLFYRFNRDADFVELEMNRVDRSNIYTASIETEGIEASQIDYYIQAKDFAGNIVLDGYAFSPLVRTLQFNESLITSDGEILSDEAAGNTPMPTMPKKRSNTVYYALGVLAVAAIILAAGGEDEPECCLVDLTLTPPRE